MTGPSGGFFTQKDSNAENVSTSGLRGELGKFCYLNNIFSTKYNKVMQL